MHTLTVECDVTSKRTIVVQLPPAVSPGRHRIAVIVDPCDDAVAESTLTPVPDDASRGTALWARLSTLRDQAQRAGELPDPRTWDEVLTEVRQRRGEHDD